MTAAPTPMTEVLFYELTGQPLERVLATLVEKSVERGWRAVVQAGSDERLEALSAHFWTGREETFLAHGTAADGHPERQPVYLTTGAENPNGARLRFMIDGSSPGDLGGYERAVFLFDGNDADELAAARRRWSESKSQDHDVTYWKQDESGRWQKQA
jgi:DNA polymerase-3 subunit chi